MSAESIGSDPYEVVLADLRAKKAQIEQAISAIESLRGGSPVAGFGQPVASGPAASNADLDSPGAFLGMSISDAAKKLLAAKRQPLRNPDIAVAFKRGGLVLNSKEPANTIGSVLTRRASEVGDIVKVDRGTWGLKEWYPNRSFKSRGPEAVTEQPPKGDEGEPVQSSGATASVPFMITQAMREKLRGLGVSDEEIGKMTPQEAHDSLKMFE